MQEIVQSADGRGLPSISTEHMPGEAPQVMEKPKQQDLSKRQYYKEHKAKNAERVKQYSTEYYAKNAERILEAQRKYREDNSEKVKARYKAHREAHREEIVRKAQCDHCGATVSRHSLSAHKKSSKFINLEPPKPPKEPSRFDKYKEKTACDVCGSVVSIGALWKHKDSLKCMNFKKNQSSQS